MRVRAGTAAFEPVVTAGIGERHQAEAGTGRAAGTILPRAAASAGKRRLALRKMRRTLSRLKVRFSSFSKFFRR